MHMATNTFSAWKNGPGDVPTNMATIGSLKLPPGKYAIFAKFYLAQGSSDPNVVTSNQVTARLEAENDHDVTVTMLGIAMNKPEFASNAESMSLRVMHEFEHGGNAVVRLDKKPNGTPHITWSFLKITAIQVDGVFSNNPMP
jgi:hypothetical protein